MNKKSLRILIFITGIFLLAILFYFLSLHQPFNNLRDKRPFREQLFVLWKPIISFQDIRLLSDFNEVKKQFTHLKKLPPLSGSSRIRYMSNKTNDRGEIEKWILYFDKVRDGKLILTQISMTNRSHNSLEDWKNLVKEYIDKYSSPTKIHKDSKNNLYIARWDKENTLAKPIKTSFIIFFNSRNKNLGITLKLTNYNIK